MEQPIPPEIVESFATGGFDKEHYLVVAIKSHLLTPEQKIILDQHGLDIYDVLNGRFGDEVSPYITSTLFPAWNTRLGRKVFGFS